MKVERKQGIDKIQVKHNQALFWIIIILIVLFIILIFYMINNWEEWEQEKDNIDECIIDSDCVKDECCHASTCTNLENAPECGEIFCTNECVEETLDCGQGECKCIDEKCEAVFSE